MRWRRAWAYQYDEDRFNRYFRRSDAKLSRHQRDDVLALIRVFTGLSDDKRCRAREAFQLLRLAHIPDDFKLFKDYFPEREARAAWAEYLDATGAPIQPAVSSEFVKPAYPPLFLGREADVAYLKNRLGVTKGALRCPLTTVRGWPGLPTNARRTWR